MENRCDARRARRCWRCSSPAPGERAEGLSGGFAVAAAELVDAAATVDDLLLTRVERMTRRADFDVKVLTQRRTRRELVAARANDLDGGVVRMDFGFHD